MVKVCKKTCKLFFIGLLLVGLHNAISAEPAPIAIIIDDIGNNLSAGERVIYSPLPYACSILPARPHSIKLANLAHQQGKEVMLHLPMQASSSTRLGHGALTTDMSEQEFTSIVDISIDAIPHVRGVNNHMGSLLTSEMDYMQWLMQTIANRDKSLFFVDSKTSKRTVAATVAHSYHIPSLQRDVFLDDTAHDANFVRQQIERLRKIAKQKGYALAIGHPHKTTLSVLEQEFSRTGAKDVRLVSVSELIEIAEALELERESNLTWQKYSSHSPKVVKN